ncbi:MAG: pyridoxal-phosphate dependent enzyme [Myxococcota bacterium]|nr:pyridoxal-phosphate dependent enzyme [Deltaproteobacteria bacterium]MDQ3336187.1 pyridoxal-phosphate dependent enzyme [Myxococcota bacterium]
MLALAQYLPRLAARIPAFSLGEWPTPIATIELDGRTLWVKDEGASNALYGGNKIRTLEMWFGHARERGAKRIWAIGAYGSNHAIATVVHAPTAGLEAGVILFPQPTSEWAVENCVALIASGVPIVRVPLALMPFAALRIARRERDAIVMPPGGATPTGTMGALSGALELATQIDEGRAPAPKRIVLGVGSTCTISGLVAGLSLAHAIGVWRWPVPIVHGVRVTPWPVTSPSLIADLAYRTLARIERLGGPRVATSRRELLSRLVIDGKEIGQGYGRITERGDEATRTLVGPRLDGVYTAKAAAGLLRLHRSGVGPLLFWASKSRALLAAPADDELCASHPALLRWLRA